MENVDGICLEISSSHQIWSWSIKWWTCATTNAMLCCCKILMNKNPSVSITVVVFAFSSKQRKDFPYFNKSEWESNTREAHIFTDTYYNLMFLASEYFQEKKRNKKFKFSTSVLVSFRNCYKTPVNVNV